MAAVTPTSVKDVPKDKFIAAYAEHLKANDKV
jgi:ribosomal protein S19E (S16A)